MPLSTISSVSVSIILFQCILIFNSLFISSGVAPPNLLPPTPQSVSASKTYFPKLQGKQFFSRISAYNERLKGSIEKFYKNGRVDNHTRPSTSTICEGMKDKFYINDGTHCVDISREIAAINYYLSPQATGNSGVWNLVSDEDGIKSYRANPSLQVSLDDSNESKKWPCVRADTIVHLSTNEIISLLMDSTKSHLINKYSTRRDIEKLHGGDTIIVSNRIRLYPSPFRFEFVNFIHCHRTKKATVIISKSIRHPKTPTSGTSQTFLGANILFPLDERTTAITSISHVKYAGVPYRIVEKSVNSFLVTFVKQLQKQAKHRHQ